MIVNRRLPFLLLPLVGGSILCLFMTESLLLAQGTEDVPESPGARATLDLTSLSLEELLDIEVTSVSKMPERYGDAAAALHVLTQEDIRRSGMTNLPDLLRMVPGLNVGAINASTWGITSRGFNAQFGNKLLVLIDGRTVYWPFFSGVFWDAEDVVLEDIERIEVIRGPGATLWGANAVNGVINILTKKARDTQGGLVSARVGTEEQIGALRYGGSLGSKIHYRAYLKYKYIDDFKTSSDDDGADEWDMTRGGFRLDWELSPEDLLTFHGDLYYGEAQRDFIAPTLTPPGQVRDVDKASLAGGNFQGRWTHTISGTSRASLQAYYSRMDRDVAGLNVVFDILDLEAQHQFEVLSGNTFVWGLGYRWAQDHMGETLFLSVAPSRKQYDLVSAFLQDEIRVLDDRLHFTIGSKFEYSDLGGFEAQPSARVAWIPNEGNTVWGAVSRAVRTPNRVDNDTRINFSAFGPPGSPVLVSQFGNNGVTSEDLLAFELGYRVRPVDRFSVDIALFYNIYDDLRMTKPGASFFETSPPPPHLVLPNNNSNDMDGETYGIEVAPSVAVTDWWRITAAYSFLRMQLHSGGPNREGEEAEDDSPRNQFHARSHMDLPFHLSFDAALFYVDSIKLGMPATRIPSYIRVDARLAWRPTDSLEISAGVQNALDDRHPEFVGAFPQVTEPQRAFYAQLVWRF